VIVDGYRELLLGLILSNDVLFQELLDLHRPGQAGSLAAVLETVVVGDDVVADFDTLVADEYGRPGDELAHIALILVAKGTAQNFGVAVFLGHVSPFAFAFRLFLGLRLA
jgi:hypothetical protein